MCLMGLGEGYASDRHTGILILNHAHIVDCIFAANLERKKRGYAESGTAEVPALSELFNAVKKTDSWYIDYVSRLSSQGLEETIDFTFTDGALGRMSREEMLAHVITHSGYHRGEVGRIISQLSIARPRDIFTGYLHKVQPTRRERP